MTDFELKIFAEKGQIEYSVEQGIELTTIVLGLRTLIEDIAEKNDIDKDELKLGFFMIVAECFAGYKVYLLNHYITQFRLKYMELKRRIKLAWNIF